MSSVKLIFNDTIRRVQLESPSFDTLLRTVRQLFGLSTPFALSWVDSDSDSIAIDSDAELLVALRNATNGVVRIFVKSIGAASQSSTDAQPEPVQVPVPVPVLDREEPVRLSVDSRSEPEIDREASEHTHASTPSPVAEQQQQHHQQQQQPQQRAHPRCIRVVRGPCGFPIPIHVQQHQQQQPRQACVHPLLQFLESLGQTQQAQQARVHVGVTCDERSCGRTITGTRFKCAVCPGAGFDLCEQHIATTAHPTAHPFIRIVRPEPAHVSSAATAASCPPPAYPTAAPEAPEAPAQAENEHSAADPFVGVPLTAEFFQNFQKELERQLGGETSKLNSPAETSHVSTPAPADTPAFVPSASFTEEEERLEKAFDQLKEMGLLSFLDESEVRSIVRKHGGAISRIVDTILNLH